MSLEDQITPMLEAVANGERKPDDFTAFQIICVVERAITAREPIINALYLVGAIVAAGSAFIWLSGLLS